MTAAAGKGQVSGVPLPNLSVICAKRRRDAQNRSLEWVSGLTESSCLNASYLRLTAEEFIFCLLRVSKQRVLDHAEHGSCLSALRFSLSVSGAGFAPSPLSRTCNAPVQMFRRRVARSATEHTALPLIPCKIRNLFLGDRKCIGLLSPGGMSASGSAAAGGVSLPSLLLQRAFNVLTLAHLHFNFQMFAYLSVSPWLMNDL